jgi:hypothetical protein
MISLHPGSSPIPARSRLTIHTWSLLLAAIDTMSARRMVFALDISPSLSPLISTPRRHLSCLPQAPDRDLPPTRSLLRSQTRRLNLIMSLMSSSSTIPAVSVHLTPFRPAPSPDIFLQGPYMERVDTVDRFFEVICSFSLKNLTVILTAVSL